MTHFLKGYIVSDARHGFQEALSYITNHVEVAQS